MLGRMGETAKKPGARTQRMKRVRYGTQDEVRPRVVFTAPLSRALA